MASKKKSKTSKDTESGSKEEISLNESDEDVITSSVTRRSIALKTEKPCATSTPASSKSRSMRSSSPLTIERAEEKDELAHLNDRLAYYIDYVRSLEAVKDKLTKRIKAVSETETMELDKLKNAYEDELKSLRRMVDDLARDKANLEIALKNAKEDALNNKRRADKKDSEILSLQRKVEQLERELLKQKSDSERYMTLVSQHDILEKKCAKLSKDLDAEILNKSELENENATLREQMDFNDRIYREERSKLKQSRIIIEEEIEDQKKAEYESKLADELRQIREETAEEFESYKIDFEESFMIRLNDLKKQGASNADSERKLREELYSYRSRCEKIEQDLNAKAAEVEIYRKRVRDLEIMLNAERQGFEDQLKHLRLESEHLREELQNKLDDFSNLMSTKIALDQEILMYRKLLEGEESRCNITIKQPKDTSFSVLSSSSKKRKLNEKGDFSTTLDFESPTNLISSGRETFRVDNSSKGEIEFTSSPDCTGKFVKLVNNTHKDVCVGGWTLNYKADNMETVYKFHHNLHIKANSDCTIWSSDSNETHNPPSDLVMKGQRFFSGNKVEIGLINGDDQEVARSEIVKEFVRSSTHSYNRRIASRSRRENANSCSLM